VQFGTTTRMAVVWRSLWFALLVWLAPSVAAESLQQILEQTGAQMQWHSWQQRGQLQLAGRSVFFITEQPYLIFSNGFVVQAQISYSNGVIGFDKRASQLIEHFLKTGTILSERDVVRPYRIVHILIDPGHGGRDSGAIGQHGRLQVMEKDVVLAVALELERLMKQRYPDKSIILTRRDDSYPSLQARVDMANSFRLAEGEAAIFISIHANAARSKTARGFEVWHLPASVQREIYQGNNERPVVQGIINDLINQEYMQGSRRLAQFVQQSLHKNIGNRTLDRGLREQAWFVVRGAHTVAILVELGFVSNEGEARLLATDSYQKELARALLGGLTDYITHFEDGR
jgi:N-acetylmuramoyl-L-alanine amidase